jgi:hypothetical protein
MRVRLPLPQNWLLMLKKSRWVSIALSRRNQEDRESKWLALMSKRFNPGVTLLLEPKRDGAEQVSGHQHPEKK